MFDPNDFNVLASAIMSTHGDVLKKLADEIDARCIEDDLLLEAVNADRIVFFLAGVSFLALRHKIPFDEEDMAQIISTITTHNAKLLLLKYLPVDEFARVYDIFKKYK
nr:MAG TPA: hypothetical protein [Caudoviricetes sp.]